MSLAIARAMFARVPALIVRPVGGDAPAPTVVWLHGFGADKELHLPELCCLAEAGLLAVGMDAVGHGQRRLADFEQQFSGSPAGNPRLFYRLVSRTAAELPQFIDMLVEGGLTDPKRVAVAGVSMGGCIVYGAVTADRRIGAAAALLGSPEWLLPDSPHLALDRFSPTALLSITAENDTVVPSAAAQALHTRLSPRYREHPDRLSYREIAGAPHFMSPEDWASAVGLAREWLTSFLF